MSHPDILRRFAVFAGENCYPLGGWDDLATSFDSAEEAISWIKTQERIVPRGALDPELQYDAEQLSWEEILVEWWHVVDLETKSIVDRAGPTSF